MACLGQISKFFFAIKNVVFVENHYSAYFWLFWRSYDEKKEKKLVTRDVTNLNPISTQTTDISSSDFFVNMISSLEKKKNSLFFLIQFILILD